MDLHECLTIMDAPEGLLAWTEQGDYLVVGDATDTDIVRHCPRAEWLPWLLAAQEQPLRMIAEVCCEVIDPVLDLLPEGRGPLEQALEVTRAGLRGQDVLGALEEAATRVAGAADTPPGAYRMGANHAYAPLARAVSYMPQVAAALIEARERLAGRRLMDAQRVAATLGSGTDVFVGPSYAIVLLASLVERDPIQGELLFVPAALAEVLREMSVALAGPDAGEEGLSEASASLADELRKWIPVRE